MKHFFKSCACIFMSVVVILSYALCACAVLAPAQPTSGPNGSNYNYECIKTKYTTSQREYSTIYYPSSTDETFPAIGFLHGFWLDDITDMYEDLLTHLCRKGYIVFSLNYQEFNLDEITPLDDYPEIAASQLADGFRFVEENKGTIPQLMKSADGEILYGLIGHSFGGVTSVNIAAGYSKMNIPHPRFVVTLDGSPGSDPVDPKRDLSTVHPETNILMIVGQDEEQQAAYDWSMRTWEQIEAVPSENRQWIEMYSDKNGSKTLKADHGWCLSSGDLTDTFDYYGSFKWCTAIANDSFYGTDREYWYGGTDEQLYMGEWSDGTAVTKPSASSTECYQTPKKAPEFSDTILGRILNAVKDVFMTVINFVKGLFGCGK